MVSTVGSTRNPSPIGRSPDHSIAPAKRTKALVGRETVDVDQLAPTWGAVSTPLHCDRLDRIDITGRLVASFLLVRFLGAGWRLLDEGGELTTLPGLRRMELVLQSPVPGQPAGSLAFRCHGEGHIRAT